MKKVEIFTDGACSGNPGVGGYCAILKYNGARKEICGGDDNTTNNRMELIAVLEGLKALKEPCEVKLYTDSKYVSDSINKGWLKNWIREKRKAKNMDLWNEIVVLLEKHRVEFIWIKGHAGNMENERCDKVSKLCIKELKFKHKQYQCT